MFVNTRKRALLTLGVLALSAQAGLVNAISVIVNDEPITLFEIHKTASIESIPLRDALDVLIQERLQESQIKKLGISADPFEVQNRIEAIAAQNGISIMELRSFITNKGMSWDTYKKEIEKSIKEEKLYSRIFANSPEPFDVGKIRAYYEKNIDEFKRANKIVVTRYNGPSEDSLKQIKAAPMSVVPGVSVTHETLSLKDQNQQLQYLLNETPIGSFTPIVKDDSGVKMYLVESKEEVEVLPFEKVQNFIANRLEEERRSEAVRNYFEKLKARADIVVLRRP